MGVGSSMTSLSNLLPELVGAAITSLVEAFKTWLASLVGVWITITVVVSSFGSLAAGLEVEPEAAASVSTRVSVEPVVGAASEAGAGAGVVVVVVVVCEASGIVIAGTVAGCVTGAASGEAGAAGVVVAGAVAVAGVSGEAAGGSSARTLLELSKTKQQAATRASLVTFLDLMANIFPPQIYCTNLTLSVLLLLSASSMLFVYVTRVVGADVVCN